MNPEEKINKAREIIRAAFQEIHKLGLQPRLNGWSAGEDFEFYPIEEENNDVGGEA